MLAPECVISFLIPNPTNNIHLKWRPWGPQPSAFCLRAALHWATEPQLLDHSYSLLQPGRRISAWITAEPLLTSNPTKDLEGAMKPGAKKTKSGFIMQPGVARALKGCLNICSLLWLSNISSGVHLDVLLDRLAYQPTQWTVADGAYLPSIHLGGHSHLWCH